MKRKPNTVILKVAIYNNGEHIGTQRAETFIDWCAGNLGIGRGRFLADYVEAYNRTFIFQRAEIITAN